MRNKEISFYPINAELIESYKTLLLNYLKVNKSITDLISSLFLTAPYSIIDWIEGIEGETFQGWQQTQNIKTKIPSLEDIKNVEYSFEYLQVNMNALYTFFAKKEYETYEEVPGTDFGPYYVADGHLADNINAKIFEWLEDYNRKSKNSNLYVKQVDESRFIRLNTMKENAKFIRNPNIGDYDFPYITIEIDKKEYLLFGTTSIDISSMIFLPVRSSLFFYKESNILKLDEQNLRVPIRKHDEPVIYFDEESNKYIVTNSYEKLFYYNRYVSIPKNQTV